MSRQGARDQLLEIGCGPGFLLGRPRRAGGEEDHPFDPESPDALFMGEALEYLAQPLPVLRIIHGWLKPA